MNAHGQQTRCRWCGGVAIKSHLTPKCILNAARAVLGDELGDLRNSEKPNLVVQDIGKTRLLCKACDNSFSPDEENFCKYIYRPLLSGFTEFEYGDWLRRFAISIGWKRLATGLHIVDLQGLSPAVRTEAEAAMSCWENFLRGKSDNAGHYEHHLFFTWPLTKELVGEIPWHLFRSTFDTTIIPTDVGVLVMTFFPGCVLVSAVFPADHPPFKVPMTSRILPSGRFTDNQTLPGDLLLPWAADSERYLRNQAKQITPKQGEKMKEFAERTSTRIRPGTRGKQ